MGRQSRDGELPRVQFVSKPMDPPYADGSKCLVRDLCLQLTRHEPHVLVKDAPSPQLGEKTVSHRVYRSVGTYQPALLQNLSAASFLAWSPPAELWHFVFAPNPRSSKVAALLKRLRKVPTVQTVASPPRQFQGVDQLLFGDVVVTQSAWTRQRLLGGSHAPGYQLPQIVEIPPPAPEVLVPGAERLDALRAQFQLRAEHPLFVYPGDLEVSRGADRVVEWAGELSSRLPGCQTILAYRDKTSRADGRARELAAKADPKAVQIQRNVPDIWALLSAATAVLFPVDDLFGKVDLPIVLLEALVLGVPVLVLDEGPLHSLGGAVRLSGEPRSWMEAAERLGKDAAHRAEVAERGRRYVLERHDPSAVAKSYEKLYDQLLTKGRTNRRSSHSHFP